MPLKGLRRNNDQLKSDAGIKHTNNNRYNF